MTQTIPDTMQAAALDRFGGIETITLQTLPVPAIGPDDVLIRVEAAGVGVRVPLLSLDRQQVAYARQFGLDVVELGEE